MKVVQLIQRPQLRGAEIFAHQLSKELRSRGHESLIVTVFDSDSATPFDGEALSLSGSPVKRLWDWNAWKRLAEIISREKPDIIQANAGDTLKYAVFSKLFFRWRTPIIFRNASTISFYIKSPFARWWNSILFQVTTYVISVSEFSKKDFVSTFPAAKKKITVIPIGVDMEDISQSKVKSESHGHFFLHIGGFTFEKNHRGLISIFEKLKSKFPNAILGLVGDGPLRKEIEQLVISKKIQDSVNFYGFQKNPAEYLQKAQCLLLPSIIEGMPAVVLEAFLFKVPVVAYEVGGISEILIPDETGWLIKKNDEAEFFQAVCKAIEDREKSAMFTNSAFILARKRFSIKEVTNKFIATYIEILSRQTNRVNN